MLKINVLIIGFSLIISGLCLADTVALTDDQLGDFIAEEGVCNVQVVDGCNTSPKLKLILKTTQLQVNPSEIVNDNHRFLADHGTVGTDIISAPGGGISIPDYAIPAASYEYANHHNTGYQPVEYNSNIEFPVQQNDNWRQEGNSVNTEWGNIDPYNVERMEIYQDQ